jgi:hypothetical protein
MLQRTSSAIILRSLIVIAFCLISTSIALSEIIPPDRRINWDPGVRGGIPTTFASDCTASPLPATSTASQINSAITTCSNERVSTCGGQANCPPRVLRLAAGNFNISGTIILKSYVLLKGAGERNDTTNTGTALIGSSAFSGDNFIEFGSGYDSSWSSPSYNLVSPTKGSATITTVASHSWVAGDIVLIDMLEAAGDRANKIPPIDNTGSLGNCGWCGRASGTRPVGQWVKIVSVPSSTTATIDPPLYYSYHKTPQGTEMRGLTHYAGLEDLTINNLSSSANQTVGLFGAINNWMRGVVLIGNRKKSLWGYGALWFTMEKCHVIGAIPVGTDKSAAYDSDRAYGPFLGPHFTAGLITNNIFEKLTMAVSFEGVASGNVFSYNFITNMWWKNTGDSPRRFGPLMHGPHPFMNLVEGNWSGSRIRHDEYWGTSSHFTYLRNRVIQVDRGSGDSQNWTVDIERNNWYMNFVGNVLGGGPNVQENYYELINGASSPYSDSRSTIWKIGYKSLGSDNSLYDVGTLETMIRWGNWSYRSSNAAAGSGIVWSNNPNTNDDNPVDINDQNIPNSYYLTNAPSWFAGYSWPPYDPKDPTLSANDSNSCSWSLYGSKSW